MGKRFGRALAAALILAMTAVPAGAQSYSDSYSFIKAVRDRDGAKVESLVATPGSIVINTRDRGTGEGALHIVARGRDLNWLSFLLAKGAKPDIQNNQGETPLVTATLIGWTEGAELLLTRRASVDLPNRRGETPLILAVQRRDINTVRLLLSRRADPNRTDNVAGNSAIDYARLDSRSASILKLLEARVAASRPAAGPTH